MSEYEINELHDACDQCAQATAAAKERMETSGSAAAMYHFTGIGFGSDERHGSAVTRKTVGR